MQNTPLKSKRGRESNFNSKAHPQLHFPIIDYLGFIGLSIDEVILFRVMGKNGD
jgi:hypothetical protein